MGTVNYVQKGMPRFKTREKEPNLLSEPRANLGIRNDKPNKFQKQKKSRVKRKTKVLIFFFFSTIGLELLNALHFGSVPCMVKESQYNLKCDLNRTERVVNCAQDSHIKHSVIKIRISLFC